MLNAGLAPDYRAELRLGSLRLIRNDIDKAVEVSDNSMTPRIVFMLADIHARGIKWGES